MTQTVKVKVTREQIEKSLGFCGVGGLICNHWMEGGQHWHNHTKTIPENLEVEIPIDQIEGLERAIKSRGEMVAWIQSKITEKEPKRKRYKVIELEEINDFFKWRYKVHRATVTRSKKIRF